MKTTIMILAAVATLLVGAAYATGASQTISEAGQPARAESGDERGGQHRGRGPRGGEGPWAVHGELHRRTLDELGITPIEMVEARIAAIESMVEDELIPERMAERMTERLNEALECLESADDPADCRPEHPARGHRGGPGGKHRSS